MVLTAESDVRADLIRQFHQRKDTRSLAETLMDIESDDALRLTIVGLLDHVASD
jgi:hypothetical protein